MTMDPFCVFIPPADSLFFFLSTSSSSPFSLSLPLSLHDSSLLRDTSSSSILPFVLASRSLRNFSCTCFFVYFYFFPLHQAFTHTLKQTYTYTKNETTSHIAVRNLLHICMSPSLSLTCTPSITWMIPKELKTFPFIWIFSNCLCFQMVPRFLENFFPFNWCLSLFFNCFFICVWVSASFFPPVAKIIAPIWDDSPVSLISTSCQHDHYLVCLSGRRCEGEWVG